MAAKTVIPREQMAVQDRCEIEGQVERILQHPLFHQSRRLPAFLRYIVNESMRLGPEGSVKERTVGMDVFGRPPNYDNNADPIVRVTATELRKKLAQYYYEDGHIEELRIELPPGAYLPRFWRPAADPILPPAAPEDTLTAELAPFPSPSEGSAADPPALPAIPVPATLPTSRRGPRLLAVLLAANLAGLAGLGLWYWTQWHSPLDRFWAPIAGTGLRTLIIMPVIGSDNTKGAVSDLRSVSVRPNLSLEDTNIAVRIAGQLERHRAPYRLVSSAEVTFDEVRTGPSVLIGALDNIWTARLTQKLPFVFQESPDHRTGRIVDVSSSGARSWTVDIDMPHTRIAHDYGVVARFTNDMTGEPVVVIAGISSQGTQAAGELLSSAEFEAIRTLARDSRNFEVVIEAEAIDGQSGKPKIVATKTW